MKLVYLWIESYKHIKKHGYLLNSSYDVQYDSKKKELKYKKHDNIDSLLYGDKISVTAIVGDNGAGKSTLLDAIRTVLFDEISRGSKIKGFLLWESEGKLKRFDFMDERTNEMSLFSYYGNSLLPDDFNLIYYSDILDIKYYLEEFDDGEAVTTYIEDPPSLIRNRDSVQINISTSYLLRESAKSVLDYFHGDIKRQINFYGSVQGEILPFHIPTSLSVELVYLDIDIFNRVLDASLHAYEYRGMSHHVEINSDAFIIGLLKKMERVYKEKTVSNKAPLTAIQILQWDILVAYVYDLLDIRKHEHEENNDYSQVDKILKKVISFEISEDNFWYELDKVYSNDCTEEENFETYLYFYHKSMEWLNACNSGDFNVNICIEENMLRLLREKEPWSYILSDYVSKDSFHKNMIESGWSGSWEIGTFIDFYVCYMKVSNAVDFFRFSWGMSSGESNMFNLYARLYDAMKKEEKEKIILLFDELDSSFHPQWQQEIIISLRNFLMSMYPKKEFQIILTTHSPVLLSDVPKDNVIFLKKENTSGTEHEQTFAANIASLYYDSFFMKKGSIGEVAKESIAHFLEAISELEKEENTEKKWEKGLNEKLDREKLKENSVVKLANRFLEKQCVNQKGFMEGDNKKALELLQKFIDTIGEDIWRYKMNESFHHYLGSNEEYEISEIQDRLRELEQKRGKDFINTLLEPWMKGV